MSPFFPPGASSDFDSATKIAKMMVTRFGMCEKVNWLKKILFRVFWLSLPMFTDLILFPLLQLGVMTYTDMTAQSPETQAAVEHEVRVLLKVCVHLCLKICTRKEKKWVKRHVHPFCFLPCFSRSLTSAPKPCWSLTPKSTRTWLMLCSCTRLWMPKRSSWFWRERPWTPGESSEDSNIQGQWEGHVLKSSGVEVGEMDSG